MTTDTSIREPSGDSGASTKSYPLTDLESRPRRSGLGTTLVLAIAFLIALGGSATAHDAWFTIWGYNIDMWSGVTDHFWHATWCPSCPYDYMTPQQAEVTQTSSGGFYWRVLEVGAGWLNPNGCCAYGYKGHTWIYDSSGGSGYVYDSALFMCDDIQSYGTIITYMWSVSPSHWDQDSGVGGTQCFYAYTQTDKTVVTAAP